MSDLEKAKELLKSEELTCALCSGGNVLTSRKRGVAPLLEWLDEGRSLGDYSAADKVVGNGAAFLYVLLGVKEIYADVISKSALNTLTRHNISAEYRVLTEAIRNRDNTGFCPIETAVAGISSPEMALEAIRSKLKEMKKQQTH